MYAPFRKFELTPDIIEAITRNDWPGNVRELENAVKRAIALAGDSGRLSLRHLLSQPGSEPPALGELDTSDLDPEDLSSKTLKQVVEAAERVHIRRVLEAQQGNRTRTAKSLGISRKNLWEKMRHYQID